MADGFSARGTWVETPAHLIDVMGSIVDATGVTYPTTFNGHPVLPLEGSSLIDMIEGACRTAPCSLSTKPIEW